MKKILLLITLCFVVFLASCSSNDIKTQQLIYQYDQYLEHDIRQEANFDKLINHISNDVMHGLVYIKITIRTALGFLVEERTGTGFIFDKEGSNAKILTSYHLIKRDNANYRMRYDIYDFQGHEYTATLINASETFELATLAVSFNESIDHTKAMTFATNVSLPKEPVFMLSNFQRFRNSLTMGLISSYEENNMSTTLAYDPYCLGATLLNSFGEVIGIMVDIDANNPVIYYTPYIQTYLDIIF